MTEYRKSIICERADICPIYKNWVEQTKDNRLDIIQKISGTSGGPGCFHNYKSYCCIALDALSDKETGIPKNKELTERIKSKNPQCSVLEFLENSE